MALHLLAYQATSDAVTQSMVVQDWGSRGAYVHKEFVNNA